MVVLSIILGMHFSDLYTRIRVKIACPAAAGSKPGDRNCLAGARTHLVCDPHAELGPRHHAGGNYNFAFFALSCGGLFFEGFHTRRGGRRTGSWFVGINPVVEEMAGFITRYRELGLSIAGYVVDGVATGAPLTGAMVLGPIADLRKIVAEVKPTRIVSG